MTTPSASIDPDAHRHPYTFNEVLRHELGRLRPDSAEIAALIGEPFENGANPDLDEMARAENLRRLYREIGELEPKQRLSALCLSGGGIRSATFNLGVLQALAGRGLLDQFDYLSTVSGGGYTGGWLKAWMRRSGTRRVCQELRDRMPDQPLRPEPRPVDRLREFSNFLTPRRGLLSGDTWAALAIIIRNLLLNWLIIVPMLMAVAGVPLLYLLAVEATDGAEQAPKAIAIALMLALIAAVAVHRSRHPPTGIGTAPKVVKLLAVAPLVLSAVALTLGVSWIREAPIESFQLILFALVWCVLLPLVGWSLREPFWQLKNLGRWPLRELLALIVSGLIGALLLVWVGAEVHPWLVHHPVAYAILAVPVLLGIYLLARSLFVAFTEGFWHSAAPRAPGGAASYEDADTEWWARLSGYVVLAMATWLVVSAVSFLGWLLATRLAAKYGMAFVSGTGLASGIVSVLLGKGGDTGSGHGTSGSGTVRWKGITLAMAAPLFLAAVFVLLGYLDVRLIRMLTEQPKLLDPTFGLARYGADTVPFGAVGTFVFLLAALVFLAALMGLTVNVNRFSLHGLYRNRLVRAYLGASNSSRMADPFTGFARSDNLALAELWQEGKLPSEVDSRRPLLVVNTTLNLVRGGRLAWQQRQAESFSMSSFFCGNFVEGYRPTSRYSGRSRGMSLGSALAISGAAANPNMGYHSSPFITFLLGALNARLGAWQGNTNHYGRKTYTKAGPRWAVWPLFAELLGLTDSRSKYVQLSDGGHFDNLGLYEMVLRRCRFIVVSDAGRDPSSGFEDLGNAIRKIRIDFGISVEFTGGIKILPRTDTTTRGLYCAVGTIRYDQVDGCSDRQNGTLLYFKPALGRADGTLPYDVYSYAHAVQQFPHESTADQWFDESQFESYRALGVHVVDTVLFKGPPRMQLEDLERVARDYIKEGTS